MGTNYYAETNVCPHCKRSDVIHIGKQSYGWRFLLHVERDDPHCPNDILGWRKVIFNPDTKITDEYNEVLSVNEMWEIITQPKPEARTRGDELSALYGTDGYDLSTGDFF